MDPGIINGDVLDLFHVIALSAENLGTSLCLDYHPLSRQLVAVLAMAWGSSASIPESTLIASERGHHPLVKRIRRRYLWACAESHLSILRLLCLPLLHLSVVVI